MTKRILAVVCAIATSLTVFMPSLAAADERPVLYSATITTAYGMDSGSGVYPTPDIQRPDNATPRLGVLKAGAAIDILEVLPNYVEIRYGRGTGFVLRKRIENVVTLNPSNTPRYGTTVSRYYARLGRTTDVKAAPDASSQTLITLQEGAMLGLIDIVDGWAQLIYHRQYAYVNTEDLPAIAMVAPSEQAGTEDMPIAVFNSFYNIAQNEMNLNRIENLKVGCRRMDRVMAPGETLDFNDSVGPFSARNGYLKAWGLVDGERVPSSGGGSCQISSTLYNVVLQLTGLTVLARAPHGLDGASYLPHGVDATSGGLNFIIRNDYGFPIRITSHVQDGALYIAIYKETLI